MANVETKEVKTESFNVIDSKQAPFKLIDHNGEITIAAGGAIVSDKKFESFEDAEKYIDSKPYELIINLCCYTMQLSIKDNENKQ